MPINLFLNISVSMHSKLMNRSSLLLIVCVIVLASCSRNYTGIEDYPISGESPDYLDLTYWASHPDKEDYGDNIPGRASDKSYEQYPVDVFFIHPTTYTRKREAGEES